MPGEMLSHQEKLPGCACLGKNLRVLTSKFNAMSCCFRQISISILDLFLQPPLEVVVICVSAVSQLIPFPPGTAVFVLTEAPWALPGGNLAPGLALARGWGAPASLEPVLHCWVSPEIKDNPIYPSLLGGLAR